jgi:hypothetical protein
VKFNDDDFIFPNKAEKDTKKKVVAFILSLMFIRSKKLENNLLDSEKREGNSKINKKQKKKLQNDENSDKKKFFLSRTFNFTNREQNIYLPANLSKKRSKRAIKSAKQWTNEDLAKR